MKTAVALTSQVMEFVCQLPGVATLDWCDRAATTLTRFHPSAVALVAVGQVDGRCGVASLELVGAAASPGLAVDLEALRGSLREGEWLGWTFGQLAPGACAHDEIKSMPAGGGGGAGGAGAGSAAAGRRAASGLHARWEAVGGADVLLGAVGLASPSAGRVLVAELAISGATPAEMERFHAVFGAVLPLLGVRYINAIGPVPADRHSWLTPREETILWKLVAGKKVPQIANELHRSVYTVHDHVKSLHRKLGATNRGQLVSRALGHLGPLASVVAAEAAGAAEDEAEATGAARAGRN